MLHIGSSGYSSKSLVRKAASVVLAQTPCVIDTTLHSIIGQRGRRAGQAASWLTAALTDGVCDTRPRSK